MVETSTAIRCPAGIWLTTQGSCTFTRCRWWAVPVSRTAETSWAGRVSEPSGPRSCRAANSVTSPESPAVTASCTVDEPTTSTGSVSGAELNTAVCPGTLASWVSPEPPDNPCAVPSSWPRPGRLVTAAGVPPAGALICWSAPVSATGLLLKLAPVPSG